MRVIKIKNHADERGALFETWRKSNQKAVMSYVVITQPGRGRDIDQWHVHEEKEETFVPVYGKMALAINTLDDGIEMFRLDAANPVAVTVERGEGHSVANIYDEPGALLVLCDNYYDPEDEGREPMKNWNWEIG